MGLIKKHKKIIKFTICYLILALSFIAVPRSAFSYDTNDYKVKRVISLVFDDSGSMTNNNQDYDYASYALQNIIGMMNEQDELYVVKLSNIGKVISYKINDYGKRVEAIADVKNYSDVSSSTDFLAVDTAANYLKEKKSQYGDNLSYKYYLVVLTDGKFDNYPSKLTEYLANLKNYFVNSFFKGIFIGIGDDLQENIENDVKANDNYYFIKSTGKEGIVDAVFNAHDIIYNRETIPEKELSLRNEGKTLSFYADKNVKRVIVFEQDQESKVNNISSKDVYMDRMLTFRGAKSKVPILKSYITHATKLNGAIPYGNVVIDLEEPIDKSYKKLRVMVEYTDAEASDKIVEPEKTTSNPNPTNPVTPNPTNPNTPNPTKPITPNPIDQTTSSPIDPTISNPTNPNIPTNPIDPTSPTEPTRPTIDIGGCRCSRIGIGGGCRCSRMDDIGCCTKSNITTSPIPWPDISFPPIPNPSPIPGPNPSPTPSPGPVDYLKRLPILPLIILALLLGYLFKNRFDTEYHAFEKYDGNELVKSNKIKTNTWTKYVPYMAENGYGQDLFIKAANKKDRVIISKMYLTEDMLRNGDRISLKDDLTLFENIPLTKNVGGKTYTYLYKSYKNFEKNT